MDQFNKQQSEDGDPVELGEQVGSPARRYLHMDIWGGCCATWDVHLDEIAKIYWQYTKKFLPAPKLIEN